MAARQSVPKRHGERMARAALALGMMAAATFSLTDTLAQVVVRADPSRAHAIDRDDGRIAGAYALQNMLTAASGPGDPTAERLARAALRQDATAVSALAVLGVKAQIRSDPDMARAVFGYALKLSRRDLRGHSWVIEDAVNRGDIATALRHYDLAMRTNLGAQTNFFQVLSSAIAEPKVRAMLLPILRESADWVPHFLQNVATNGPDLGASQALLGEYERSGMPVSDALKSQLVDAYARAGNFPDGWRYYAAYRPKSAAMQVRNPAFAPLPGQATRFDWTTPSEAEISAKLNAVGDGAGLDFFVPPGVAGVVVEQVTNLGPGRYRLAGAVKAEHVGDGTLDWVATCIDGRQIGAIAVVASGTSGSRYGGTLTVPGNCSFQFLRLQARNNAMGDGIAGLLGAISVELAL